ncbi:dihydroxyacetone kinase family protein [Gryllotalpicola reticulitermitis]|uniref:Dihydroxyacetone kinase family protein n=1 Tax=Gryllotalpicola reticulitermitis TaxID=1184153 RepID=A0ABV8Q0X7_9MICO
MKKIINDPEHFVDEFLEGIVLSHPDEARLVAGGRGLVRADAPVPGKVGIVTGGGSGHLPAFLGYVGRGLLDGAAVGNVFSSPSAEQIAAVTRAVDGGAGVLYLYGNYGGDVYNFDIAGDLVRASGIRTETVLAADDVASAPREQAQRRRGVAGGIVFGFLAAGAAAERGDDLDAVAAVARRVGERVRTEGVGLSPTILPAAGNPTFELPDGEMEIGIGIHGEPGLHRGPLESADEIADRLLDAILADLPDLGRDDRVAVLVNGLGATPLEELYVVYRRVAHRLAALGIDIAMRLVGEYVTSLEMAGASISLLVLDDELEELLSGPAVSPFLRRGTDVGSLRSGAGPAAAGASEAVEEDDEIPLPASALGALLTAVLERMPAHADELRELDAALGDGDLGITVSAGARASVAAIARNPGAPGGVLLRRLGAAFASANPSTFAALVGGGILSAAVDLGEADIADRAAVLAWARATAGEIARRGGAQPGDKTVLDAVSPSLDAFEARLDGDAVEVVEAMLAAAEAAVAELAEQTSARGRAAWLQARSAGLRDPGMVAYRDFLAELRAVLGAEVG